MCTDLLIVSKTAKGDPLVVNARSQEFDTPLGYRVILRKEGVMVQLTQPSKEGGVDAPVAVDLCVSRYDYLGIMMTKPEDPWIPVSTAVFDGMNSAGLSVGGLNAPGSKYQMYEKYRKTADGAVEEIRNVFAGFFADWMLSQYATCAEVKAAFRDNALRVIAETVGFEGQEGITYAEDRVKLHFAVHDAAGHSLVIEFIDGEATLTDNPVGVLTNLPVFSWHLTNLGQYAHLSNYSTTHEESVRFGEMVYAPPGSMSPGPLDKAPGNRSTGIAGLGDGLAGIPGDFRPSSRFVRTAYMKHFAVPPETENEAVSQAFHLLNGVDMVKGAAAEKAEPKDRYDTAQCIMVKDLVHKVFYVRMYESPLPYSIAFKDFRTFAPDGAANAAEGVQMTIPNQTLAQPFVQADLYAGSRRDAFATV
jgi:choloylglycine hydrolase